jgi:hypothetical protein
MAARSSSVRRTRAERLLLPEVLSMPVSLSNIGERGGRLDRDTVLKNVLS